MRVATVVGASLLAASCAGQCGARGGLPPPRPPTVKGPDGKTYHLVDRGPYKAFYDAWGRLQRIEYDSNGDGRPDHTALHDGRRHPHRMDVDSDFDGRTDRWEQYDDEGRLLKVGTASAPGKAPDLWTTPAAAAAPERREHDANGDGVMERAEILRDGRLAEVHVDGDRLPRVRQRAVAPPRGGRGGLHGMRDDLRRPGAGGVGGPHAHLRPLEAAVGLGRLRPLREPQPLRRIPRDGDPSCSRIRRGVGAARPPLVEPPAIGVGRTRRSQRHRHRASRGGRGRADGGIARVPFPRRAARLWGRGARPRRAAAALAHRTRSTRPSSATSGTGRRTTSTCRRCSTRGSWAPGFW